ncbi:MAG: hypothetical protein LBS99_06860 [Clostridiales bacterium]|jgi:hypothetical protein|nr:hypothetical protein [Clostridiales bacterium]
MKNKKSIITALLALTLGLTAFGGCGPDGGTPIVPDNPAKGPGYTIERDKYFYGVGEAFGGTVDDNQTPELTTGLAGALGMQSFRMWMHTGGDFVELNSSGVVSLNAAKVAAYHGYTGLLAQNNVTNIIAMSHYYRFPAGFPVEGNTMGAFPEPGSQYYEAFLEIIEQTYYLLAKEFPEIKYWECGNEINADAYCHKSGYYNAGGANAAFRYTLAEKAQIGADLMFYATRGIKRGNPAAVSVMPGLVFSSDMANGIKAYLTRIYQNIESGVYPTTGAYSSVKTDDYFDVLNWHPYNFGGNSGEYSTFTILNQAVYDIVIEHGDEGKKVFFTEYGYTTTENQSKTREQYEALQGGYIAKDVDNIQTFLPFVEVLIIFRMFDWERASQATGDPHTIEIGFGLFTSPGLSDGPRPKAIGLSLFRKMHGENADVTPLYAHFTGAIPA